MIVVVGEFRLAVDKLAEAHGGMERVIVASRAEPGCLSYSYAEDLLQPGLFRVIETWQSREALAAHFESPHMIAWRREREELGMSGRIVTAYAVASEEAL
jgi:quinol monooxygenase YgiN